MGSLLNLATRLEKIEENFPTRASDISIKIATAVLRELIYATPVDTSTALSGWQINLKEPPATTQYPFFYGTKGSTREASASAAYAEGVARLAGKKPGETVYISNLTEYIGELNRGSSAQAPAGFVERAVLAGKISVRTQ